MPGLEGAGLLYQLRGRPRRLLEAGGRSESRGSRDQSPPRGPWCKSWGAELTPSHPQPTVLQAPLPDGLADRSLMPPAGMSRPGRPKRPECTQYAELDNLHALVHHGWFIIVRAESARTLRRSDQGMRSLSVIAAETGHARRRACVMIRQYSSMADIGSHASGHIAAITIRKHRLTEVRPERLGEQLRSTLTNEAIGSLYDRR